MLERALLCLKEAERINGVLLGLRLDWQEGRTRVCMRREGSPFSLGPTITPQQKKQAANASTSQTRKLYLDEADGRSTSIYASFM